MNIPMFSLKKLQTVWKMAIGISYNDTKINRRMMITPDEPGEDTLELDPHIDSYTVLLSSGEI